ncbi:hypothetical protein HPB50_001059 [Hyalomma asiaticum]|uniref:Uncharacterized protein n=1 Tax=Hyalomma asiaticum TaxID=266040 RepID=A0ACB7RMK5_HYAAI|nr:hypothetical protein HPB50_001059 [Hyalomma asiaticum]
MLFTETRRTPQRTSRTRTGDISASRGKALRRKHLDYGVILFTALFVKHPEYQQLFKKFRDKQLSALIRDPAFTDHATTVGRQITAMVESLDTPGVLLEIIAKNVEIHTLQSGVTPEHFVELGHVIVEMLCTDDDDHGHRAVVKAWEKLLLLVNMKTEEVYANELREAQLKSTDPYKVELGMSTANILSTSSSSAIEVQDKQKPSTSSHYNSKTPSPLWELPSNKYACSAGV